MLHTATTAHNQTVECLKSHFHREPILFTLVGSAACREYGLSRSAKDLDFVVNGYPQAMTILTRSGEYKPILDSPDPTGRTCTRLDLKTGTAIDFLAEGIRISDGIWLKGFPYSDPLPIPFATGFGDVASLLTLITMKVNCIKSGLETIRPRGEHRRLMI